MTSANSTQEKTREKTRENDSEFLESGAFEPATPVKIDFLGYSHYAIVSDSAWDGKPMLISLTHRTGTVREEPWDDVVQGRKVRRSQLESSLQIDEILARARAEIGRRKYNVLSSNCEHFVREALGLPARSQQVEVAAGVGLSALALALRVARGNPYVSIAATAVGLLVGSRMSAR